MKASWIFLAMLLATGSAAAQMYKWVDKDGNVSYGSTPPPGAKTSKVKAPAADSAAAPAAASKDAKDAGKGPLTPAEQEQEYRKRQAEAQKDAAKAEQERRESAAKQENCERSKESLRMLESGQRIARTDGKGERYFLDEGQLAKEGASAREMVQQSCN